MKISLRNYLDDNESNPSEKLGSVKLKSGTWCKDYNKRTTEYIAELISF